MPIARRPLSRAGSWRLRLEIAHQGVPRALSMPPSSVRGVWGQRRCRSHHVAQPGPRSSNGPREIVVRRDRPAGESAAPEGRRAHTGAIGPSALHATPGAGLAILSLLEHRPAKCSAPIECHLLGCPGGRRFPPLEAAITAGTRPTATFTASPCRVIFPMRLRNYAAMASSFCPSSVRIVFPTGTR